MKIYFKTLKIKNFLSFAEEEFDFSAKRGMCLVCGKNKDIPGSKNGCGKTAVFSALLYALYGQLQNKVKNENVKNRYVKSKDMELRLEFSVDGVGYTIVRGLERGKMSYLQLFRGTEDITKSSIAETDEFLVDEVLHCDISIFSRIIYLTSEQTYNFFRLKSQPKKEFIEKLFDISVFGDMFALIHKDVLAKDKEMAATQASLLTLTNTKSSYEEHLKEFAESQRVKVDNLKEELGKARLLLESVSSGDGVPETDTSALEARREELNGKYVKFTDAITRVVRRLAQLESDIRSWQDLVSMKGELVSKHAGFVGSLCEKCAPKARKYFDIGKYEAEVEETKASIESARNEAAVLSEKKTQLNEKFKKLKVDIAECTDSIRAAADAAREARSKREGAALGVAKLEAELAKAETAVNPYVELLQEVGTRIREASDQLEADSHMLDYLKTAESIVSQDSIRKFIVNDLVSLLNANIRNYLLKMGANYTCIFDENMDYEFVTDGGRCEYDNFSSGEKMRLLIASSFAFKDFMMTRTNIEANILVLDEFIDSNLDTKAINSILEILKEYAYLYHQSTYVISHRHEIDNGIFDNIVQVVKDHNVSHIEYLQE